MGRASATMRQVHLWFDLGMALFNNNPRGMSSRSIFPFLNRRHQRIHILIRDFGIQIASGHQSIRAILRDLFHRLDDIHRRSAAQHPDRLEFP